MRNTRDLDICYAPEQPNLEALGRVLLELGARLRGIDEEIPFVPDARTLPATQVLTLGAQDQADIEALTAILRLRRSPGPARSGAA